MPYNGLKAERDKKRLAEAILAAKGQQLETDMPMKGNSRVSSGYGPRIHPITKKPQFHTGTDLPAPEGTPIYATEDGVINQAQNKSSGSISGNNVSVRHNNGEETRYAHMKRFSPEALKGGMVKKGTLLGYVGSTGRSTGPHLHYGRYKNNKPADPMETMVPWQRKYAGV